MQRQVFAFAILAMAFVWTVPQAHAGKFKLFGTAADAIDPQNPQNDTIKVDTSQAPGYGGVSRKLPFNTRVIHLRNQLSVKYYLAGRSCGGGSPRVALMVDMNENGRVDDEDASAFAYVGDSPNFNTCPSGEWVFQDLTDGSLRWDLTQLGGSFYNTWAGVVAAHGNKKVLEASLVDDSNWLPAATGVVYFDLVTLGNATMENKNDTVK